MIRVQMRGGRAVGVLTCDVCGELILDASRAAALPAGRRRLREGALADVLHVHEGLCREGAEARLGGGGDHPSGVKLSEHLLQVASGVGLDPMESSLWVWDRLTGVGPGP
jgi:hypothetical protein